MSRKTRILLRIFVPVRDIIAKIYDAFKARFKASATFRYIITLGLLVIIVPLYFHSVVSPRLEVWAAARFPELVTTQKKLESQFPDKKVETSDFTFYTPDKQRIFSVALVGDSHASKQDAQKVKEIVCSQLGDKAKDYDLIFLESATEKRFWLFYTRDKKSGFLGCIPEHLDQLEQPAVKPSPPPPAPLNQTPPAQTHPIQTQPSQTKLPAPKDGDFQLEGEAGVQDATVTCCSLQ